VKAVVLVGGQGTRLRPLTETIKKELLPLVGRPSLDRVLDHLALHGVREVVLSSSYLEETFHDFLKARTDDPTITWITEAEPLDTGGAIAHALAYLDDQPFFALNGDILTDLDLTAMAAFHRERGADVTIALHRVEDARPFGLVSAETDGRVRAFREKPTELVGGLINAGTYVLDPRVLRRWEGGTRVNIEREIFPPLIADGAVVLGFVSDAYWLDLGTPEKYLQAHADLLDGRLRGEPSVAAPFIDPTASIAPSARLGRHVVVGPGAIVADGARIDGSVLMRGARVDGDAVVADSILGPGSVVGTGAHLRGAVLGEGAVARPGADLVDARVPANQQVG
jgi:mannose-1-phosphate guanylyltransferase